MNAKQKKVGMHLVLTMAELACRYKAAQLSEQHAVALSRAESAWTHVANRAMMIAPEDLQVLADLISRNPSAKSALLALADKLMRGEVTL